MGARGLWFAVGVMVMGIGPIVGYAWLNKLGDFAKSPQRVEMSLGSTSIVAGGRAKMWFAMVDIAPTVEVSCKGSSRMLELTDKPSEEVCGVRVRKLEIVEREMGRHATMRGVFEVTWNDSK
jgi:hypothetical protein